MLRWEQAAGCRQADSRAPPPPPPLASTTVQNAAAGGQGPTVDLPDGGLAAPEMAITLQDHLLGSSAGGGDPMAQFVGNELFPSFDNSSLYPSADSYGGGYGGGGGGSVTVAADISELFGSHWSAPEQQEGGGGGGEGGLERRFRWVGVGGWGRGGVSPHRGTRPGRWLPLSWRGVPPQQGDPGGSLL